MLLAAMSCGGCATITGSEMQSVMVTAVRQGGAAVEKADCKLTNDKGAWTIVTPAAATIRRSSEDLLVECTKGNEPAGMAKAISRAHGGMAGNIIFGGVVGALIDHNKGTGYDYPDRIAVILGQSVVVDRKDQLTGPQFASHPAGPAAKQDLPSPSLPGSPVTGNALLDHHRNLRRVQTSSPPQLRAMEFRADGIVLAEFDQVTREGRHQVSPGSDQLCLTFDVFPGARTLPFLNDCFTVHRADDRFLLRATRSDFVVVYHP